MQKLYAGFAVLVLGMGGMSAAQAAGLELRLSEPSQKDFGSGKIVYSLSNTTAAPVQLLRWQTPLDGLSSELFQVTKNGEPVAYEGILAMRTAPTAADYVELAPGATLASEVDLTAYYDMKAGGQYEVRYAREARDVIELTLEKGEAVAALARIARELERQAEQRNLLRARPLIDVAVVAKAHGRAGAPGLPGVIAVAQQRKEAIDIGDNGRGRIQ